MACKAGVFRCAIDLDFRLTESWGESKNDSKGEVACPSSPGRALKKTPAQQARINSPFSLTWEGRNKNENLLIQKV